MLETLLASATLAVLGIWLGTSILGRSMGLPSAALVASVAVIAKLATTAYRYAVAVLGSEQGATFTSDTYRYLAYGQSRWEHGSSLIAGFNGDGTDRMVAFSQLLFTLFGGDRWIVFFAGSLLSLVGMWLIAVVVYERSPQPRIWQPMLVVLFPSSLYWSSSFGKESITALAMGLSLWALHRFLGTGRSGRGSTFGVVWAFSTATAIAGVIRPQIAALLVLALFAAWLLREAPPKAQAGTATTPAHAPRAGRIVVSLGLLLAAFWLLSPMLGDVSSQFTEDIFTRYERTSMGGSQISGSRGSGIASILLGIPVAVFRPFPWEGGFNGLASSLDSPLLLVLIVRVWRSRRSWSQSEAVKQQLLLYSLTIIGGLFLVLSSYGNLGLMVRMRSLVIPLVIVSLFLAGSLCDRRWENRDLQRLQHAGTGSLA